MSTEASRRKILAGIAGASAVSVAPGLSAAQSDEEDNWETTVGDGGADAIRDVIALESGGLLAIGGDYTESFVGRIATGGTVDWARTISSETGTGGALYAGTPSPSGGALVTGERFGLDRSSVTRGGWVVKLDDEGDVAWEWTLVDDVHIRFHDVVHDDAGYVLLGAGSEDDVDWDAVVVGVDPDGNERWRSYVESEIEDGQFDGIAVGDSGYCLAGSGSRRTDAGGYSSPGFAIGLDDEGTVRWRTSDQSPDIAAIEDVVSDCAGGFVLVGWRRTEDRNSIAVATRLGGDGTEQWRETYEDRDLHSFSLVEQTEDGFLATALAPPASEDRPYEVQLMGIGPGGDIWFQNGLRDLDWAEFSTGIAVPDRRRAVVTLQRGSDYGESEGNVVGTDTPERKGADWECATFSSSADSSSSTLDRLPGFGVGLAIGGLGIGAGLLEARRRRSSDDGEA